MSTIHCRFCGGRGHNKLSCPSVKEYYEQAKNMLANKEVTDPYQLSYYHRWSYNIMQRKENTAAKAKAAREAGSSIRKCSYCGTAGHARNKCESHTADRASVLSYEKRFRSAFAAWLPNSGIGVGAMFVANSRVNDDGAPIMAIITKVNDFSHFTVVTPEGGRNSSESIVGQFVNREGWENYPSNFSIPHGACYPNTDSRYGFSIAAPSSVSVEVSSDYLSDEHISKYVAEMFDEKNTRSTRWRNSTNHFGVFHSTRPDLNSLKAVVERMEKAADDAYKSRHAA